ncbi:MAG: restriction endonuclease subunit S [Rhodobacteraceae bacterium]|nr:restriction endonuclease subunit S [Paracoccaceae bacterium]
MSELPKGWTDAKFEDVLDYVQRGKSPKYAEASELPVINQKCVRWWGIQEEHLKFIRPDLIAGYTVERFLVDGDVLWNSTGTGTVGRAALFRGLKSAPKSVVDGHVTVLRSSAVIEPAYLFNFIRSPRVQDRIEDMHTGSTNQVELSKIEVLKTEIPLPPLPEQRRIVRKLDTLSARTTTARTHLTAIAKLVQRMRGAVLSKALNGTLFTGQIGIGEPTELGQFITDIEQGWSPKCENEPERNPDEWAVLTTTAIQAIDFDSKENKKLPSHLEPRPHLEVQVGDVLMTRAGPRVRCAVCSFVSETSPRRIFSDKVYRIRLDSSVDPEFFVMMMNTPELVKALDVIKSGGSESGLNLTQGRLKSLSINLWDVATQRDVVAEIKTQFAKIDHLAAEAAKALKLTDRLDQRILAKAFAGELVPQDPTDEPATELLARIRQARATAAKPKRGRRKKVAT